MGKKSIHTPRSRIRSALRQLWLRSRERAKAIKRDKYTCQHCMRKQSRAKGKEFYVQVHHIKPIDDDWEYVIDLIYERILVDSDSLKTLCIECHDKLHEGK